MKFEAEGVFGENERAQEQHADRLQGGYQDKYYDENESREGQEKYDLATGRKIRNDRDALPSSIKRVTEKNLQEHDLAVEELSDDIATEYFLANGYDKLGNKIIDVTDQKDKAA